MRTFTVIEARLKVFFLTAIVLLAGAQAAWADGCNRFAVQITTSPVLYQWTSGMEKAAQLLAAPPKRADVMLIGDSLLAFWPKDLAKAQFGKDNVWNFAVGGSRTQHTLWQLERLDAPHLKPREVVVLVGTNNLSDEKLEACAITAGIEAVALKTRAMWPDTIIHVMGIPPRGSDFHFRDEDRNSINRAIRQWIATHAGMHYFEVDPLAMTCGHYDRAKAPKRLPGQGSSCRNYADDFGHFKRPGYEVIYSALRETSP